MRERTLPPVSGTGSVRAWRGAARAAARENFGSLSPFGAGEPLTLWQLNGMLHEALNGDWSHSGGE